jgi:hypothetical protein
LMELDWSIDQMIRREFLTSNQRAVLAASIYMNDGRLIDAWNEISRSGFSEVLRSDSPLFGTMALIARIVG